jgi:hypothetical protein
MGLRFPLVSGLLRLGEDILPIRDLFIDAIPKERGETPGAADRMTATRASVGRSQGRHLVIVLALEHAHAPASIHLRIPPRTGPMVSAMQVSVLTF